MILEIKHKIYWVSKDTRNQTSNPYRLHSLSYWGLRPDPSQSICEGGLYLESCMLQAFPRCPPAPTATGFCPCPPEVDNWWLAPGDLDGWVLHLALRHSQPYLGHPAPKRGLLRWLPHSKIPPEELDHDLGGYFGNKKNPACPLGSGKLGHKYCSKLCGPCPDPSPSTLLAAGIRRPSKSRALDHGGWGPRSPRAIHPECSTKLGYAQAQLASMLARFKSDRECLVPPQRCTQQENSPPSWNTWYEGSNWGGMAAHLWRYYFIFYWFNASQNWGRYCSCWWTYEVVICFYLFIYSFVSLFIYLFILYSNS